MRGIEIAACDRFMKSAVVRSGYGRSNIGPSRWRPLWATLEALSLTVLVLGSAAVLGGCGGTKQPSPALPSAALLPPPPMALGPDYRVQLGDTLKVSFLFQPENDMDLVVRPDGRISIAAAGQLEAVGKTESELEEEIRERASKHLRDPVGRGPGTTNAAPTNHGGGGVVRPGVV